MRSILLGFMALFLPMVALAGPPPVCDCAVQSLPDHVHPEAVHQDADTLADGHVTNQAPADLLECPAQPFADVVADVPDGDDPGRSFEEPNAEGLPTKRQIVTAPRLTVRASFIVARLNPQKVASTGTA